VDLLGDHPELILTPKLNGLFATVGTPALLAAWNLAARGGASAAGVDSDAADSRAAKRQLAPRQRSTLNVQIDVCAEGAASRRRLFRNEQQHCVG
jgi:hypothetical protein